MRPWILILFLAGCTNHSFDQEPREPAATPTMTLRIGVTPGQFVADNSGFGFNTAAGGLMQGTDQHHSIKLVPSSPGAEPVTVPDLGRPFGLGTIVGFSSDIVLLDASSEIKPGLSSAIFYPTQGRSMRESPSTLRGSHDRVMRVADLLEAAGWEPVEFRFNNRPDAKPAVGRVDWATFEAMWLTEPASASALAVVYRSGDAEVSCSAGLREWEPPPREDQFVDGSNPAGRAAFLAGAHFGAACGFGRPEERR